MNVQPLIPQRVAQIVPHVPGRRIEDVQREHGLRSVVKLASNENPLGVPPMAQAALLDAVHSINRYPDVAHSMLRDTLASQLDVDPNGIVFGNGTTELIYLLVQTFVLPGTHVLTSAGTFIAYRLASQANDRLIREVPLGEDMGYDLDAMINAVDATTRLVFIANPNNPTGSLIDGPRLERFVAEIDAKNPTDPPIVVIDEAYIDYADPKSTPDAIALLARRPRTMILRTFSKAYGLAGIRCGYGVTSPPLASALEKIRPPFNVNLLAQVAANAALKDVAHLSRTVSTNRIVRRLLREGLEKRGLKVAPSEANFLLVDFGRDAQPIYEAFLEKGIITRPLGVYEMTTCLRISVGRYSDVRHLLSALDEVLRSSLHPDMAWSVPGGAASVGVRPPVSAVERRKIA